MPEIAARLLVPLLILLQVFGLLILHKVALPLVRGLLGGFAEQKGFRKWFFHAIGLTALVDAVKWVVHRVRQSIANAALPNMGVATLWLNSWGNIAHNTYKEIGDGWAHYADSWALFRHHTFPHALKTAAIPAERGAAWAGRQAGKSISIGNLNRIRLGRSIDRLRKEMGLLAGILLGIDILVKGLHAGHHHRDHTHTLPHAAAGAAAAGAEAARLGKVQARHSALLKALAKLATIAGFTAVTRIALGRIWPWTRCSNFGRLSKLLNCSHFGFLANLLTLALSFLAVFDPVVLAEAAITSENIFDGTIHELANPSKTVTAVTKEAISFLGLG
jgi:hypothetical protein